MNETGTAQCSDSGPSKFLLKSAGSSHHQTSVSIYTPKESSWWALFNNNGWQLRNKSIQKLRQFPIFPIQISIEWKYKSARLVLNQFAW